MSIIDKITASITPQLSEEARAQATEAARGAATAGDWLGMVLDHHDEIRHAFSAGKLAHSDSDRVAAFKALSVVLNGHSQAEEVVLYPALGQYDEKAHAAQAYLEQTITKTQMAQLEAIAPSSPEWLDKWEQIEAAVLEHLYEEEDGWFIQLKAQGGDQDHLTTRYAEEYARYAG